MTNRHMFKYTEKLIAHLGRRDIRLMTIDEADRQAKSLNFTHFDVDHYTYYNAIPDKVGTLTRVLEVLNIMVGKGTK